MRSVLFPLAAAVFLAGGVFLLHKLDKTSAVRRAVASYVAEVEITAAQEAHRIALERADRLALANAALHGRIERAQEDMDHAKDELDAFLAQRPDPAEGCRVDPDLFERLRAK